MIIGGNFNKYNYRWISEKWDMSRWWENSDEGDGKI
jgi:hypothetical protein